MAAPGLQTVGLCTRYHSGAAGVQEGGFCWTIKFQKQRTSSTVASARALLFHRAGFAGEWASAELVWQPQVCYPLAFAQHYHLQQQACKRVTFAGQLTSSSRDCSKVAVDGRYVLPQGQDFQEDGTFAGEWGLAAPGLQSIGLCRGSSFCSSRSSAQSHLRRGLAVSGVAETLF